MTALRLNLPDDRKDISPLINHQTDTPCLPHGYGEGYGSGYGAESVLAFLMQIYAYVFAKFSSDINAPVPHAATDFGGTDILKEYLMTSGPYHVVTYVTDFRTRPNALKLRQRPVNYRGASVGSWIILWPGAVRDTYFKIGRVMYALHSAMQAPRADEASAISVTDAMVPSGGYRFAARTLRKNTLCNNTLCKTHRPIRLIPP